MLRNTFTKALLSVPFFFGALSGGSLQAKEACCKPDAACCKDHACCKAADSCCNKDKKSECCTGVECKK